MNTIKSIEYIVRKSVTGFCIIESMKASNGKTYQRGIKYGLTQDAAQDRADNFQAMFDGWGYRPAA
jgi:hypothetical protein